MTNFPKHMPNKRLVPARAMLGLAAAGFCLALTQAAAPEEQPAPAPQGSPAKREFSSFRIITERNIFNASRSGRAPARTTRAEPRRQARADAFTFVGTINYEKGAFAFFDSTTAEYRKALQPGSTIAGLQVSDVSDHSVTLDNGTNKFELRMGMEMRREEGSDWSLAGAGEKPEAARSSSATESATESSSDEEDEILKRLMQKREQELK
jgi:hypothetical protein